MQLTANEFITQIIEREGGYVNHPADRGGPTNFGITQQTLSEWRGMNASLADVVNLTRPEAVEIYRARNVRPFLFAEDEPPIFGHLLDMGVHHGIGGATKILQRALKVKADGAFGPKSMGAYRRADKGELELRLIDERVMKLARIVKANPSQAVFIEGWMARCMSFLTGDHA